MTRARKQCSDRKYNSFLKCSPSFRSQSAFSEQKFRKVCASRNLSSRRHALVYPGCQRLFMRSFRFRVFKVTREDNKAPRRTREKISGNGRVALVCTERINILAVDVSLYVVQCMSFPNDQMTYNLAKAKLDQAWSQ